MRPCAWRDIFGAPAAVGPAHKGKGATGPGTTGGGPPSRQKPQVRGMITPPSVYL